MKRIDVLTLAAIAALAVPAGAQGPDARVFATSTDNEFVVVDFDEGTSQVVGRVNGSQFRGLAVRGSGNAVRVLVSSSSQGGELLIFDPGNGSSAVVDRGFAGGLGGLTVDGAGNAFALSAGGGSTAVWMFRSGCSGSACLPGGYFAREVVAASIDGAQRLADVKVAPFTAPGPTPGDPVFQAGDLLIAAARPGALFCLPNPLAEPGTPSCDPGLLSDAPAGFEPTGLAFTPNGDILVSVWEGDVLRLGHPSFDSASPFTSGGTPGNATAVAVSGKGGDLKVFVATHNGGAVTRYDLDGSELQTVSDGFQAPNGIGSLAATLSAATPVGGNQTIRATADEITFDVVTAAGVTTLQSYVVQDLRDQGSAVSVPFDEDLDVFASRCAPGETVDCLEGLPDEAPPNPLVIPAWFRGRTPHGEVATDPDTPKVIVLFRGDTSALFDGTVNHHIFEHFGADADCDASQTWLQPRLLWAPDVGGVMEDITTGCGSDVGRAWRFSWFALVHDTRSLEEALDAKLASLEEAATCLGKRGRSGRKAIAAAQRAVRRGRPCDVPEELAGLVAELDATAGSCEAEVEARALSAGYTASLLCN